MPESRRRKPKKVVYPVLGRPSARKNAPSPPWMGALILALFLLGIAWLLTYYFSNGGILGMEHLGGWNVLVGFGFIVAGLGVATQWK